MEKGFDSKISLNKIHYDVGAVRLLNKIYSFEDPECWSRPPILERNINGNFNHGEKSLKGSKWLLRCDGKSNAPEHHQLKRKSWGAYALKLNANKPIRLENWYYQYVFVEDKLKLTMSMDQPVKATVYVNLRKKDGRQHKAVKSLPMKTNVVDLGDNQYRFEGELDLAEYKGLNFDHYMLTFVFPACAEGILISDIKMMQKVSGKLYFDPADTIAKR